MTADRFWMKVDRKGTGECWNWRAAVTENGYGRFRPAGEDRMEYAHRHAWKTANGEIPSGMYVCHSCDNRLCCNPAHLWVGTHRDNQRDMAAKGRTFSSAKRLSDDDVKRMRADFALGASPSSVAALYGITPKYAEKIRAGRARAGGAP